MTTAVLGPRVGLSWVAAHPIAYPALEVLHITGIALLLGSLVVLELRVWGLAPELPLRPLARLALAVTLAGFGLIACSGLLMFAAQPAQLLSNRAFRVKLARVLGRSPDDWALWRQACGGDPRSAQALVRLLTPAALALAQQMLRQAADAEDVVQESFLRLWSARPDDARGARLSTYFHTIVLNRCRSYLVRRREISLEPEVLTELHDAQQQDDRQPGAAEPGDTRRVQAALHAPPARQRMAVAMWAYADADVAQIATALGLGANAAHQLLHRAKRSLRALLNATAEWTTSEPIHRPARHPRCRLRPATTSGCANACAARSTRPKPAATATHCRRACWRNGSSVMPWRNWHGQARAQARQPGTRARLAGWREPPSCCSRCGPRSPG